MADYCYQCTEGHLGEPPKTNSLRGLTTPEDNDNDLYAIVICEGCGFVQVDHLGRCVSDDCLGHEPGPNYPYSQAVKAEPNTGATPMGNTDRPVIRLGDEAKDTITGFTGIVIAMTNWLNGCQRIVIQPQGLHNGIPIEHQAFDVEQVAVVVPIRAIPVLERTLEPAGTGGPKPTPTRHSDPT